MVLSANGLYLHLVSPLLIVDDVAAVHIVRGDGTQPFHFPVYHKFASCSACIYIRRLKHFFLVRTFAFAVILLESQDMPRQTQRAGQDILRDQQ